MNVYRTDYVLHPDHGILKQQHHVAPRACNAQFPAMEPPGHRQLEGCPVYYPGVFMSENSPLNPDNSQYHSDYHHSNPRRAAPYR